MSISVGTHKENVEHAHSRIYSTERKNKFMLHPREMSAMEHYHIKLIKLHYNKQILHVLSWIHFLNFYINIKSCMYVIVCM